MGSPISKRLRERGLDLDFLEWLEGDQKLPRLAKLRKIKLENLAAAIRAATWLIQHVANPRLVKAKEAGSWRQRHQILRDFLVYALKETMAYSRSERSGDLRCLEAIGMELLPGAVWKPYFADIRYLKSQGLPVVFPKVKGKHTGGRPESEQTYRMRAAVEYVSTVSKKPYSDLADFWTERVGIEYHPDEIKSRLRKGISRDERLKGHVQGGESALEFWHAIYHGDSDIFLPVPFPYSASHARPANRQWLFRWPPVD